MVRALVLSSVLSFGACTSTTPPAPTPGPAATPTPAATPAPGDPPPAIVPATLNAFREAQIKTANTDARALHSGVQMYLAMKADCPKDVQTLVAEKVIPRLPVDPWDKPYEIDCTNKGESVLVVSLGPDGKRGTPDDLVVETHEF